MIKVIYGYLYTTLMINLVVIAPGGKILYILLPTAEVAP